MQMVTYFAIKYSCENLNNIPVVNQPVMLPSCSLPPGRIVCAGAVPILRPLSEKNGAGREPQRHHYLLLIIEVRLPASRFA